MLDPRRVEQACVAAADRVIAGGSVLSGPDTWMHHHPTAVLAEPLEARDDELVTITRSARCLAAAFAPGPQPLEGTDVDAAADMQRPDASSERSRSRHDPSDAR